MPSEPCAVEQLLTRLYELDVSKEMLSWPVVHRLKRDAAVELRRLQGEVATLREALAKYADVDSWYGEAGDEVDVQYVAGKYADPGTLLKWDGDGTADDDGPALAKRVLGEGSDAE